jgi:exopolysaccharide/PEP-CTERM locus tyrosine autokinase
MARVNTPSRITPIIESHAETHRQSLTAENPSVLIREEVVQEEVVQEEVVQEVVQGDEGEAFAAESWRDDPSELVEDEPVREDMAGDEDEALAAESWRNDPSEPVHEELVQEDMADNAGEAFAERWTDGESEVLSDDAEALSDDQLPDPPRAPELRVDTQVLIDRGLLPPPSFRALLENDFRRIKRPILANAFSDNAVEKGNLVMVTSALPGDGKTFSTLNLALSAAQELDRTVLLIDSDVTKRDLSKGFGVQTRPGLMDLLLDENVSPHEVIMRTSLHEKLCLIPAGARTEQSTELLASNKMVALAKELADRYSDRLIVFDTPPLLATSDAHVVASLAGQIVFVVRAGVTSLVSAQDALDKLNTKIPVNAILNENRFPLKASYYQGYYNAA